MSPKAKATAAAWVAGWLLIATGSTGLPGWPAMLVVGAGLLGAGGLRPLWNVLRDGIGYNPPGDWFTGKAE